MRSAIVLGIAFASLGAFGDAARSETDQKSAGTSPPFARMPDGRQWTTRNLNLETKPSYCHGDLESNCRRYGRLYTWVSARQACQSMGDGWRLPTEAEWRRLAKHYGGVREDSADEGRTAYAALMAGGEARFDALLGGNRTADGRYERLEAHGFYWTATENDAASAWFYNFGNGGRSLNRQREGDTRMTISVRCIRD